MSLKKLILPLVLATIAGLFFFLSPTPNASAETSDTDVSLSINSVLGFSITNCDYSANDTLNLTAKPTAQGTFINNCQRLNIGTNAPGYELSAKAEGSHIDLDAGALTNALIYQNPLPTGMTTPPIVPSTTNTMTTPATLANDTWGFAVASSNTDLSSSPSQHFDNTYTINDANGNYANLPITDTTIYNTDTLPGQIDQLTFYYASKVTTDIMAGTYQTTVYYTVIAEEIPEPPAPKIPMQNWTGCSAIPTPLYTVTDWSPYTVVLTDIRDDQDYRVRKLPDGNCWMIDNLKIANVTLNSTNSDNPALGFTIPATPTVSGSPAHNTAIYFNPSSHTACINNTGPTFNSNSLTNCGYLYNYYTATAGTAPSTVTSGTAAGSICPSGWKLPTGIVGQFAILNGAMHNGGGASTGNYYTNWLPPGPFEGALAGYYISSLNLVGSFGGYWSSSIYNASGAYSLYFSYSGVYPGDNSTTRAHGHSVRCVLN